MINEGEVKKTFNDIKAFKKMVIISYEKSPNCLPIISGGSLRLFINVNKTTV